MIKLESYQPENGSRLTAHETNLPFRYNFFFVFFHPLSALDWLPLSPRNNARLSNQRSLNKRQKKDN